MKETIVINHAEFIGNTSCINFGTWHLAYEKGYREPRYPVPVVWKHHRFTVDFDFYVQRGYVNAMMEDMIERAKDATSID